MDPPSHSTKSNSKPKSYSLHSPKSHLMHSDSKSNSKTKSYLTHSDSMESPVPNVTYTPPIQLKGEKTLIQEEYKRT